MKVKKIEEEETEEEVTEKTRSKKRRRVADLDNEYTRVLVGFPQGELDKLTDLAKKRKVSRGVIVRELVRGLPETPEKPIETNTESKTESTIEDSDLQELLSACEDFFGQFRTVGDQSFFVLFREQNWKLNQLSVSQYIVVLSNLKKGFDGFMEKPNPTVFLGWIHDLEPSNKQLELARLTLTYNVVFNDEDRDKSIEELIKEIESQLESEEEEEKEATGEKALEESETSETESSEEWKKANVG